MGGCLPRWSGTGSMMRPRLAGATIGISMSDSSHLAMQTADVVLMDQGLRRLPAALELGRYTFATIRGNLFWAFSTMSSLSRLRLLAGWFLRLLRWRWGSAMLSSRQIHCGFTRKKSPNPIMPADNPLPSRESLLSLLRQHWRYTRLPAAAGRHYSIGAGG